MSRDWKILAIYAHVFIISILVLLIQIQGRIHRLKEAVEAEQICRLELERRVAEDREKSLARDREAVEGQLLLLGLILRGGERP